jgi:hypothetical protein
MLFISMVDGCVHLRYTPRLCTFAKASVHIELKPTPRLRFTKSVDECCGFYVVHFDCAQCDSCALRLRSV